MQTFISQERRNIIARMCRMLKPILRESGYSVGPIDSDEILFLCRWKDDQTRHVNGFVVQTIEGFLEEGVIFDSCGGGLAWHTWADLPIEDLLLVEKVLTEQIDNLE